MKEIGNKKILTYLMEQSKGIERESWTKLIPGAPENAIDLISKLMTWDPSERLTAKEAI